jgi:phosphoribosylanthranilate isomerase
VSSVRIKICGITSAQDGRMVADAGADAIGLVFWPRSPRSVDIITARQIVADLPPLIVRVGVFVDASREDLERTAQEVGLDVLQLHGSERPEDLARLPRRVVKALRVDPQFSADQAARYADRCAGVLLDTGGTPQPGGTGQTFDWAIAREVRTRVPFLALAGGLSPENVAAAIAQVEPDAVDVSSGVEASPGRKDEGRVHAFVRAVRQGRQGAV